MNIQQTQNDFVIEMRNLESISLTKLEETENPSPWCYGSRTAKNITRVAFAGTLSAIGTWIPGFLPTTGAIVTGGMISGIANSASTCLAWENKTTRLIEARMITDFPKVVEKLNDLNERINCLIQAINLFNDDKEKQILIKIFETTASDVSPETEKDERPFIWQLRTGRNIARVCIAGSFSGAGSWLSGFESSIGGIIGGGVLSGVGNAFSTWFAYEKTNEAIIEKRALKDLPKLLEVAEETEKKLLDLIERIKTLNPDILMNYHPSLTPSSVLEEVEEEIGVCCIGDEREERNFWYVNVAGWMSAGGGWLAGFYPKNTGIAIGGAMGATANMISTWLAWERVNEEQVEKTVMNDFPKVVLKMIEISSKVLCVNTYLDLLEKENIKTDQI